MTTSRPGMYDLGIKYIMPDPPSPVPRGLRALRRRYEQLLGDKIPRSGPLRAEPWDDDGIVIAGAHIVKVMEGSKIGEYSGMKYYFYTLYFSSLDHAKMFSDLVGFASPPACKNSRWCVTMPKEIRDDSPEWKEYSTAKRDLGMSSGYKPTKACETSYFPEEFYPN